MGLERLNAGFAGSNAHDLFNRRHKNLAVTNLAGACGTFDGFDDLVNQFVGNGGLDLDLGQEVNDVFRAAIQLGVSFLTAKAFDFSDGIPCTPMLESASRTSSSLKGLMMAVTSFMRTP